MSTRSKSILGLLGIWKAGLGIGIRTFPKEPVLGLKRLILPVSYWRTAEFGFVMRSLSLRRGSRVLDVGSPKDLAVVLARRFDSAVVATDILSTAVELSRRYAIAQGLDGDGPGMVRSEVQDGRKLPYPDATYDAAVSISVLEHIPGDGDSKAIQELVRVVKPGGSILVTVPFDRRARETYIEGPVYERSPVDNEPVFYQRHYDASTMRSRLIPQGATMEALEIWGERRIRVEKRLQKLGRFGVALSPLHPLLAATFLCRVEGDASAHPMAAFLRLRKADV